MGFEDFLLKKDFPEQPLEEINKNVEDVNKIIKGEKLQEQDLKTPMRYRVLNLINRLLIPIDKKIGVDRAEDLVNNSEILNFFKENGKYLDIGTGPGHILESMLKKTKGINTKFYGLEPFAEPFKAVKNRLKKESDDRHIFLKGAGQQLPIKDGSLDGALLFFVVHHVPAEDRDMLFDEIERVIKKDGKIFLIEDTPADEEERSRVAKFDRRVNVETDKDEDAFLSDNDWQNFFQERGYEVIHDAHFTDNKKEGAIPHSAYVLKFKQEKAE